MPTHYKGTPEEVLALNTYIKLTRAVNTLDARLFSYGALKGLTPSQFGVLEALYHLGPMCQGEVSQKLLTSTGNMTLVLDNLEKAGLVRRERSLEDRRMVRIFLTEAGEELIREVLPAHVNAIFTELCVLTADEQQTLGKLCRKLGLPAQEDRGSCLTAAEEKAVE